MRHDAQEHNHRESVKSHQALVEIADTLMFAELTPKLALLATCPTNREWFWQRAAGQKWKYVTLLKSFGLALRDR
jgi:hypothetical protein